MKFKIALIAKLFAPVSAMATGGTETFVFNLARELKRRGHTVTLFASGDSCVSGVKIVPVVAESYWLKYNRTSKQSFDILLARKYMADELLGYLKTLFYLKDHSNEFDIVHNNSFSFMPIVLNNFLVKLPFLTTLHVPEKNYDMDIIHDLIGRKQPSNYYVGISENQKKLMNQLDIFAINYNGVDENKFVFSNDSDDYLAWIGRIVPEKGLDTALTVACKTNLNLRIGGSIVNQDYFDKIVEPKLNSKIEYMGEIIDQKLINFYQKAKVLLFPIDWEEPFGLVLIEAMACGTPIVAFNRGAVREIIKDGETGFIIQPDDIGAMVKAVQKIYAMPKEEYKQMRRNCRKHIEDNFTIEKMVDNYEKVYAKVLADWHKK